MIVENLVRYIFEDVHLYIDDTDTENPYKDIYIGLIEDAPNDIKCMNVVSIGTSSKGFLDIHVK